MGSIYRPRYKYQGRLCESSVWWVRYYVDGQVYRESTGTEDRETAKDLLRSKEADAAGGCPVQSSGRRILVCVISCNSWRMTTN